MHPLLIAGLFATAGGLLLSLKGGKKAPPKKPEVLQPEKKAGTPAPVHPESTAGNETDSTDSGGRIDDVDSLGDNGTPAPASDSNTAE